MAVVDEELVVGVVFSFFFKPSLLFSFDLLFVAFDSSSCCGSSGGVSAVVVVEVNVVVAFCFPSSVLEDDPGVDNDFKLSLGAVDEVSVALPSVSMGFEDLEFESIPGATASALS